MFTNTTIFPFGDGRNGKYGEIMRFPPALTLVTLFKN
jgi:hypothetical protein